MSQARVERFSLVQQPGGSCAPEPDEKGYWVRYFEYARLRAKLDKMYAKHPEEGCYDALPRLRALLAIYRKDHFLCADIACECCNAHDEYDAETSRLRADELREVFK